MPPLTQQSPIRYLRGTTMMSFDKVKEKVFSAVAYLLQNDSDLLYNDVNERSVSHKLAEFLQQQFSEWHVDCEYNRKMGEIKRLNVSFDLIKPDDTEARTVYPDIIVHRRNTEQNLLVIEVKKASSHEPLSKDKAKLTAFTKGDGEYRYNFGLLLQLYGSNKPEFTWYIDGRTV